MDPIIRKLPASARRLVELIGLEATTRLVEEFGGTRLYVAEVRNQRLREVIGEKAAEILSRYFGREEILVPICPALQEAMAVQMYRVGESARTIARRFRRSERWVVQAVTKAEAQRCRARMGDLWEGVES